MKTISAIGNRRILSRFVGARVGAREHPVASGAEPRHGNLVTTLPNVACGAASRGRALRPWQAGFTLIELSIAVFIIAIIMAVSVPNFVRSYNSSLLSAMGRTLVTTCEFARLNAVLHQRKIVLHVDLDQQVMWLTQGEMTGATNNVESLDQSLKTIEVPSRLGLVSAQVADQPSQQKGEAEATFYPNGTCDGFTVTFRGAEKGSGLAVVVDPVTSRGVPWPVKL